MIIFFSILLLLVFMGLRKNFTEYMSIKMTNSIKGFFLCMVFFSHIWTYTDFSHPYLDYPYQVIRQITGQCIVAMFLFYSGYGIMKSVKTKGRSYIDRIPTRRFFKVLLQFDCAVILFWIYRYMSGSRYGFRKMLMTFLGVESIGNSNWYIFCVLWLYVFTFFAFKTLWNKNVKAVMGIFVWSVLYMLILHTLSKESWWYDTILCYTWGMLFSLYRNKIEKVINDTFGSWVFFLLSFICGYGVTYFYKNHNPIVYQIWMFCFVAAIVTFTMRYVVSSRALEWMGENLFELYILQRLPMLILKNYMFVVEKKFFINYVYVIACFIITLMISVIYRKTIGRMVTRVLQSIY